MEQALELLGPVAVPVISNLFKNIFQIVDNICTKGARKVWRNLTFTVISRPLDDWKIKTLKGQGHVHFLAIQLKRMERI